VIDWVLGLAALLALATFVWLVVEVRGEPPARATLARQIATVRGLIAIARREPSHQPDPTRLAALDEQLLALRDPGSMRPQAEARVRAIARALLAYALPGGEAEAAARAWLAAPENGGAP
jgi:hypothetical protein